MFHPVGNASLVLAAVVINVLAYGALAQEATPLMDAPADELTAFEREAFDAGDGSAAAWECDCIGTRATLTGDWFGYRTCLQQSGVTFAGRETQFAFGIDGGINTPLPPMLPLPLRQGDTFKYTGRGEYDLIFDLEVLTFRCTQRVLRRLGIETISHAPVSTTRLGDWYINLLLTRRHRLLIFVSEPTLLSVFIPVSGLSALIPRFQRSLAEVLQALGVPPSTIEAETSEMGTVVFAATVNRSVLGSMNDLIFQAKWELKGNPQQTLLELGLNLSQILSKPLGYRLPQEAAMARLAGECPAALD